MLKGVVLSFLSEHVVSASEQPSWCNSDLPQHCAFITALCLGSTAMLTTQQCCLSKLAQLPPTHHVLSNVDKASVPLGIASPHAYSSMHECTCVLRTICSHTARSALTACSEYLILIEGIFQCISESSCNRLVAIRLQVVGGIDVERSVPTNDQPRRERAVHTRQVFDHECMLL